MGFCARRAGRGPARPPAATPRRTPSPPPRATLTPPPILLPVNEENPLERSARTYLRSNFSTPLDEIDAAARILDPVLAPLAEAQRRGDGTCEPQWGAFLKDYHVVEW